MSSGMDSSILDTYLYEENNLLDQLDEMLVADEKNGDFFPVSCIRSKALLQ